MVGNVGVGVAIKKGNEKQMKESMQGRWMVMVHHCEKGMFHVKGTAREWMDINRAR